MSSTARNSTALESAPVLGELRLESREGLGVFQLSLGEQKHAAGFSTRIALNLESPQAITMSIQTEHPITLRSLYIELQQGYDEGCRVFINGLQSWTESREFSLDERIPPLRGPFPRLLNTTGDYTFFNYSNKAGHLHSHMGTYLQSPKGARKQWTEHATGAGYTIFQHWIPESLLGINKECAGMDIGPHKEVVLFDISIVESHHGQAPTPGNLADWAEELPAPCIGWTSWYHYYTRITEGIILQNLTAFQASEVPAGVFQIDDGWQPAVGDWTSANAKFPQGMAWLAGQIHAAGHQAGLWLAPFIVEQKSKVFLEHPEWLLTHDGEHPVAAGFNPGWGGIGHGTYYVLDIAQPEVQAHLADVFKVVLQDWGYDLVKLDFLFTEGLIPRMGHSRGQWMRMAMQLLRDWCGDKLILGCGVPLGPARGLVDYCRIGPDVGLHWDMRSAKLIHLRERISTLNALRNTISRFALPEKGFRNDPDVFILRSTKNRLLPAQRHSSFLLNNLLGDLIFTSDNLAEYDAATLALYLSAFPVPQSRRIQTHDLGQDHYQIDAVMDGRRYLVFANLGKKAWDAPLPPGRFACGPAIAARSLHVPAFTTRVCLDLAWCGDVLWSELHIFPGVELGQMSRDAKEGMDLVFREGARMCKPGEEPARIWIKVDGLAGSTLLVNGQETLVEKGLFGDLAYVVLRR